MEVDNLAQAAANLHQCANGPFKCYEAIGDLWMQKPSWLSTGSIGADYMTLAVLILVVLCILTLAFTWIRGLVFRFVDKIFAGRHLIHSAATVTLHILLTALPIVIAATFALPLLILGAVFMLMVAAPRGRQPKKIAGGGPLGGTHVTEAMLLGDHASDPIKVLAARKLRDTLYR